MVLVFLFAPLVIVVLFAFDAGARSAFPIEGLSFRWFDQVFGDDVVMGAALNSIIVAAVTTLIAVFLGTMAALAIVRHRVRFSGAATSLIVLPVILPPLLIGIALLSFFGRLELTLSLWTVVAGHVLITVPFVVLTLSSRLATLDPSLEEAAATMGANRLRAFQHVTLPLLRSALMGSALIVVALSLDEFIITFMTIGSDNTLPTVIWGQMRAGVSPVVNAISTLMLVATLILMLVARRLTDVRFQ
ncbi:MAG: ABC transporter permease [Thermoleophilia bacterium]|nr:ABC transporter permease [Thermoleophilia bacterium]